MISTHKGCLFRDIEAGTLIRTGACFHFSCDWRGFARKKNDFQFHLWRRRRRRGWCSNPPKYSPGICRGDRTPSCINFVVRFSEMLLGCLFMLQLAIWPIRMMISPYVNCRGTTRHMFMWSSAKMQWVCHLKSWIGPWKLSEWSYIWNVFLIKKNDELVVPIEAKQQSALPIVSLGIILGASGRALRQLCGQFCACMNRARWIGQHVEITRETPNSRNGCTSIATHWQ